MNNSDGGGGFLRYTSTEVGFVRRLKIYRRFPTIGGNPILAYKPNSSNILQSQTLPPPYTVSFLFSKEDLQPIEHTGINTKTQSHKKLKPP